MSDNATLNDCIRKNHDVNFKPHLEAEQVQKTGTIKHRPVFGNQVYLSHPESKFANFKLNPIKPFHPESRNTYDGPTETPTTPRIMDSCTQTSKTILQLAKLERGLSPDSLMQSPREPKLERQDKIVSLYEVSEKLEKNVSSEDSYTLDGSFAEEKPTPAIPFMRKSSLQLYLDELQVGKKERTSYPDKSLTETFLAKKHGESGAPSAATACDCRSLFLQQTSPLRNLMEKCGGNFKSRSCVGSDKFCGSRREETPPPRMFRRNPRFTVKNIKQQMPKPDPQPLKCLWTSQKPDNSAGQEDEDERLVLYARSPKTLEQTRRNSTFMSPTIASEQRSEQHKVRNLLGLISPTRRGKSLSPNRESATETNLVRRFNAERIPYIDRSDSTVKAAEPVENRSPVRKNISRRDEGPTGLISPLVNNLNLDQDMLKIDLQSLDLKTSEETIAGSTNLSYSESTASTDNAIFTILTRIRDPDWSVALKGIADMTELCRIMDSDLIFPHMTTVNQRLLKLLKSPRSHVCRTACQAAGHFFESIKDTRRPEFDDIVENLLCRTADANKFIRKDANLSLDCMVTHIPIFHSVRALCLKGPSHKNAQVRIAVIRLIVCAVVITGPDVLLNLQCHEPTRKRVVQYMAKFLGDKDFETRKYAERLYKVLSKEQGFESCLRKYLEKDDIIRIKNILKNKNQKR